MFNTIAGVGFFLFALVLTLAAAAILTAFIFPIFGDIGIVVAIMIVIMAIGLAVNWFFTRRPEPSGYHE